MTFKTNRAHVGLKDSKEKQEPVGGQNQLQQNEVHILLKQV